MADAEGREDDPTAATLDPERIADLFERHGDELRRFVLGVVRNPDLAADVVQTTFARAVERIDSTRGETVKGWLFRVAFHEAITTRRRRATSDQVHRRLFERGRPEVDSAETAAIRVETVMAVREALGRLPENQRQVVWARIHEAKTFREIAEESGLPLGTVLTRMRLALARLRDALGTGE